jgi:Sec-independent protein translocase protein TatA
MTTPIELSLKLDLDKHLMGARHYDPDSETYETEPTTLEGLVIDTAARLLFERITGASRSDGDWVRAFRSRFEDIRDEQIAEAIRPRIEAAMTEQIQKTDSHGHACGEPQTVGELVLQEAKAWMSKEVGDYHSRSTQLAKVIAAEVNSKLTREFQDAIAKGKAQIKQVLEAEAAKVLAETLIRQAKV